MQEQQNVGKARIIGYAVGVVFFLAVAAWKWIAR
jgi:hypothetical protein